MKGIYKLACAFGAMASPAFAGWLWGNVTNLETGIVILVLGTLLGAACMDSYSAIERREG